MGDPGREDRSYRRSIECRNITLRLIARTSAMPFARTLPLIDKLSKCEHSGEFAVMVEKVCELATL